MLSCGGLLPGSVGQLGSLHHTDNVGSLKTSFLAAERHVPRSLSSKDASTLSVSRPWDLPRTRFSCSLASAPKASVAPNPARAELSVTPSEVASDATVPEAALQSAKEPDVGGPSRKLRVGFHKEQGLREEMEDAVVVEPDSFGGFLYAAVFDGHVGTSTVKFLKEELYNECMEHLEGGKLLDSKDLSDAAAALENAFVKTDERLLEWLKDHAEEPNSGSTATAVFARHDRLFVAHLGDSRAVMAQGGDSEVISEDHRPHGESPMALAEKQRVVDAGGWVSGGRVCGMLAVSRAFGNQSLKHGREKMLLDGIKRGRWTTRFVNKLRLDSDWVSVVPDVYATELGEDAEFVLIASDGMWDAVRSSEAVRFIHQKLEEHNDVQRACEELVAFALKDRKSDDNVSACVISFI